jgi:hypothetical protein
MLKNLFDNKAKFVVFYVGQKALPWDFVHSCKGKHTMFQKNWMGAYIVVVGNNMYLCKDEHVILCSFTTNGSHLKLYIDPDLEVLNH